MDNWKEEVNVKWSRAEGFVSPCWFCLVASLCFSLLRGLRRHFASLILNLAFCLMGGARASAFKDNRKTKKKQQTVNHSIYRIECVEFCMDMSSFGRGNPPPLIQRLAQWCISFRPRLLDRTSASGGASGGVPLRGCFTELYRDSTAQCVAVFWVWEQHNRHRKRQHNQKNTSSDKCSCCLQGYMIFSFSFFFAFETPEALTLCFFKSCFCKCSTFDENVRFDWLITLL